MTALLAAEGGAKIPPFQAEGFLLENVFIIPLIMAISFAVILFFGKRMPKGCLLYTSPSPRDLSTSRMPSSA